MKSEILHFHSILTTNRDIFLLNYGQELQAFEDTDKRLHSLAKLIATERSDNGKSHVSLSAFMLIIERQGRNAFECLSQYQSYQSWIIFRPAIEATLLIGKFLNDPKNAELWKDKKKIWTNRKTDKERFKKYKKEFEGNGLIPKSLNYGKELRNLLSRINDEFIHMNYEYFTRSHDVMNIDSDKAFKKFLFVDFVDPDPDQHKAHLYSFLHLYRLVLNSLGQALGSKFSKVASLGIEIESIERIWGPRVKDLAAKEANLKSICVDLGLWNL